MAGLTVRIEEPEAITAEWKALLGRSASPTVFQHPSWHRIWAEVFPPASERVCYTVREESGGLLGIAPMLREPENCLAFAGDPEVADYMDIVAPKGSEAAVFAALIEGWRAGGVPAVRLWGLRENCRTLELLGGEGQGAAECEEEAVAPRIPVEGGWEAYLGRLSKKDRHELRRKLRRLESSCGEIELSVFSEPSTVDDNLDEFFRLHTISRQDKAEFMTDQMRVFFRSIALAFAEAGLTRLFLLNLDGVPAASLLAFEGEDLAVWNSGFDPAFSHLSVGLLSKVKALQWAQERGHTRVDFLRGREPYKYDLGGQDLRIFRCRLLVASTSAVGVQGGGQP